MPRSGTGMVTVIFLLVLIPIISRECGLFPVFSISAVECLPGICSSYLVNYLKTKPIHQTTIWITVALVFHLVLLPIRRLWYFSRLSVSLTIMLLSAGIETTNKYVWYSSLIDIPGRFVDPLSEFCAIIALSERTEQLRRIVVS